MVYSLEEGITIERKDNGASKHTRYTVYIKHAPQIHRIDNGKDSVLTMLRS